MATILDDMFPQLILCEESDENNYDEQKHFSLWIKENDVIRPSINVSITSKLEPGVYNVFFTRENGLCCKKIETDSDQLFVFSDSIYDNILNEVELFWSKKELYAQNKLIHKRGILFEGYSGVGKSSLISILSNGIINKGGIVFKVTNADGFGYYVDFLRMYFRKIQPDTPIITILEDIDSYGNVEGELLDFLDGKTNINHHIVIATTNNTEAIPDTYLRPSRLDLRVEIKLPSENIRKEYLILKGVPVDDVAELVKKSEDFTLADLKELYICIYMLDYSIDDAILKITEPGEKKDYLNSSNKSSSIGV